MAHNKQWYLFTKLHRFETTTYPNGTTWNSFLFAIHDLMNMAWYRYVDVSDAINAAAKQGIAGKKTRIMGQIVPGIADLPFQPTATRAIDEFVRLEIAIDLTVRAHFKSVIFQGKQSVGVTLFLNPLQPLSFPDLPYPVSVSYTKSDFVYGQGAVLLSKVEPYSAGRLREVRLDYKGL